MGKKGREVADGWVIKHSCSPLISWSHKSSTMSQLGMWWERGAGHVVGRGVQGSGCAGELVPAHGMVGQPCLPAEMQRPPYWAAGLKKELSFCGEGEGGGWARGGGASGGAHEAAATLPVCWEELVTQLLLLPKICGLRVCFKNSYLRGVWAVCMASRSLNDRSHETPGADSSCQGGSRGWNLPGDPLLCHFTRCFGIMGPERRCELEMTHCLHL